MLSDTGGYNFDRIVVSGGAVSTPPPTGPPSDSGGLSPYGGSPASVPGTIQAENFDEGGEGVAYHDTTAGNAGGAYRWTAVDIEPAPTGGYDVGWIDAGEWLNYTVDVASAGTYLLQLRVASPGGGIMHVGFNAQSEVWTEVNVPATGGWQAWTTLLLPATLSAGTQQMTLLFDTGGYNVDSVSVTPSPHSVVSGLAEVNTVFVIVMENANWSQIAGNAAAPYINRQLLPAGSHAENYFTPAGIHPSLPNYLWLEAGTNFGITDDGAPSSHHQSTSAHLVTLLNNAGISWKSYQEDIAGYTCPLQALQQYAPKHNPMVYFDDVTGTNNPASTYCVSHVRPYFELATDLANGPVRTTSLRRTFVTTCTTAPSRMATPGCPPKCRASSHRRRIETAEPFSSSGTRGPMTATVRSGSWRCRPSRRAMATRAAFHIHTVRCSGQSRRFSTSVRFLATPPMRRTFRICLWERRKTAARPETSRPAKPS